MEKHRFLAVMSSALLSASLLAASQVGAQEATNVDAVLQAGESKTSQAEASQTRIDQLVSETEDLAREFKQQNKFIDDLRIFNAQMEKQVSLQLQVVDELNTSIEKVTVIERQIQPLIFRMLDSLEQFVKLDKPFSLRERQERLAMLRANQDRADLPVSEKFRQVLEAYKIESAYGTTIEAYKDTLPLEGQPREVNILRVGRIALMYQTTDTTLSGYWDSSKRTWVALDNSYKARILKGLRIARDQTASDIMVLPVQAPERSK